MLNQHDQNEGVIFRIHTYRIVLMMTEIWIIHMTIPIIGDIVGFFTSPTAANYMPLNFRTM